MQGRASVFKLLGIITVLMLSGCSLWPSPGYGGYAEHTETSPSCNRSSDNSQFALLDQQLGCLNLRLETLTRAGADLYLPASVLRAQEQSNRTFREITGRLLDDARIDLMILSAMLDDIERQLHSKQEPAPKPVTTPDVASEVLESVVATDPIVQPVIDVVAAIESEPMVAPEPVIDPVPVTVTEPITFVPIEVVDLSGLLRDINQSGLYLTGSAKPNPLLLKHLGVLADALMVHPDIHVLIVGHTDDDGDAESNFALGLERARNIQVALIQFGVAQGQVCVLSSGEAMPAFVNEAPESRLANRRIEVSETSCK